MDSYIAFLFTQVTYLNTIAICCMIPVFRTDILQTQNTTIWPQGFMWLKDIFLFLPLLGKSKTHTLREEKKSCLIEDRSLWSTGQNMTCLHCLDRIFIVYLHTILIGLQNLVFYPDVWRKLYFVSENCVS